MTADELVFFVNGKKVVEKNADPETTLLVYLRRKLGLCGTKLGCGEGGCGACTVMISKYDRLQNKIVHFSVNACLAPICSLHHVAVTTVEGIGNTQKLHPVQVSGAVTMKPGHFTGELRPRLQLCSGLLGETSQLEQRGLLQGPSESLLDATRWREQALTPKAPPSLGPG